LKCNQKWIPKDNQRWEDWKGIRDWEEMNNMAKPFHVPKEWVKDAYNRVKANQGAAGVDGQSIDEFERNFEDNLYKIWNRMSSGSYFPPPVLRVEIDKEDGSKRPLGIPTVADRTAQMVVKMYLEPLVEPIFHPDSYGYRPGKSAKDALETTRKRCWKYDWVLDLDIKGFFDNIDHELVMRAVREQTTEKWVILYIERWLKAPVQVGREIEVREKGTPQGGVISPLLANLFLHYAFDKWMEINFPHVPYERYADDIVCHCHSKRQSEELQAQISKRLNKSGLELHPKKTKIVYCKDDNRRGDHQRISFDFLGFTFKPRQARNRKGELFLGFTPAISRKALKRIRKTIKKWRMHVRSDLSLEDIAKRINAVVRGWINYYGSFCKSALYSIVFYLNSKLIKWAMRKMKRLRGRRGRATGWLERIKKKQPQLFDHWHRLKAKV
jgi:group II intron reverse transcriptase/maturase